MKSSYLRVSLGFALIALLWANASAQHHGLDNYCKHEDPLMMAELIDGDPAREAAIDADRLALEQFTQQFALQPEGARSGSSIIIPVVFHVIHDNGIENISAAQVHDAMRVLNDDFNKLNADTASVVSAFSGIVADIGIEFRLAQLDPNGNCTSGINRIQSPLTYDGDQDMKDLIQWPRDMYLNVWTCAYANGAAGYTYRPPSVNNGWGESRDGIVLQHNYTGSIGTASVNNSRTLTHEVGHWLNLSHLWGGTNTPGLSSNCSDDDNVSDTPNSIGWTSCNLNGISCGTLDNVQNYMEYAYCSRMFTEGQKTRMLAAANSGVADRNELWTPANLAATGTDGTSILCAADFSTPRTVICAGDSIQFFDESYHGITSRSWTFQGGSPSSSIDENPWVVFNTPGNFEVILDASNGSSTVSLTRTDYITVLPSGGMPTPYSESFEGITTLPSNDWMVMDNDNDGSWMWTDNAAYTGTNSIMLVNDPTNEGYIDEVISSTIDVSNATDINISFRYAYAARNSADNDILRLYVSRDCGVSWSMRKQLRTSTGLSTAPEQNGSFIPSGQSEWGYEYVDNISTTYHVSDFRFKFWFQGDGGNYIYLDDINVNGLPVSISEVTGNAGIGLAVFPSPVDELAQISLDLLEAGEFSLEIFNAMGQYLGQRHFGRGVKGNNRIDLPMADLQSGVYLLKAVQGERSSVLRFVKN